MTKRQLAEGAFPSGFDAWCLGTFELVAGFDLSRLSRSA